MQSDSDRTHDTSHYYTDRDYLAIPVASPSSVASGRGNEKEIEKYIETDARPSSAVCKFTQSISCMDRLH